MAASIRKFSIQVPESTLTDLKTRLSLTRYPQELILPPGQEWSYGTPANAVRELVEYWQNEYDWRKVERELNETMDQFITTIDVEVHGALDVHFVHQRSKRDDAIPLIFVHGWPGNFMEVIKILQPLVDPPMGQPAFHVVAPSIPGYCFSQASSQPGLGIKTTASIFDILMKRLGYEQYLAQGGDWGGFVVKSLATWHPNSCRGVHSNFPVTRPPSLSRHPFKLIKIILGYMGLPGGYSQREIEGLKSSQNFMKGESAYFEIQSTYPQTLAYGLTDSPAGLLGWMYEKLHSWTDSYPWKPEEIITWVMLYWVSTAGPAGSVRYYKENKPDIESVVTQWTNTPLGVSIFPKEMVRLPDDFGSMIQPLKFFKFHEEGGHFAAWEKPDLLVEDVRAFADIIVREDPILRGQSAT